MENKLLLWKTIGSEQGNFPKLLTKNYFYWSQDSKLNSLEIGDYLFIVDINSGTFLFVSFAGDFGITTESDQAENTTTVYDKNNDEIVEANGTRWGDFIKFKILQRIDIKSKEWLENFKFTSTNGTMYLYKKDIKSNSNVNKFRPSSTVIKGEVPTKLLELDLSSDAERILLESIEYAKKFTNEEKVEKPKKMLDIKTSIQHADDYIASSGFRYKQEEIANFYLALRAKPFVILAGISGTGKTQLPRQFAKALGFGTEQVIQVPVRPDWTDSSDLLGYTSLTGKFIPKDLTIAIQKAENNPDKPYFFILDEMNLARVEHYFSDYLSVIETRIREGNKITTDSILREEILNSASNKSKFEGLGLPQNIYLIGTVNMDETTHAFSKKVLDRANSIEMNDVDLSWIESSGEVIKPLDGIPNDFFVTPYLNSHELSDKAKASIDSEMKMLKNINDILEPADLHFAYRVRDEIAFYLLINKEHKLINADIAFDFQIVQKILPRIHGSSERVQTVLVELLNLFEGTNYRSSEFDFSMINIIRDLTPLKYKRASKKIIFMLKRFDDDRFTSFWL